MVLPGFLYSSFAQNNKHATGKTPARTSTRRVYTYRSDRVGSHDDDSPPILNRSWTLTAYIEVPVPGAEGVIVADGGTEGGYALYMMRDGRLNFVYNYLGSERFNLVDKMPLPPGKAKVEITFEYKGRDGEVGKGAKVKMYYNDVMTAERELPRTIYDYESLDEGIDIGMDAGSPVDISYTQPFAFTGEIEKITIALK